MRSLLLVFVALLACLFVVHASPLDDATTDLSEVAAVDSFHTLESMGMEEEPSMAVEKEEDTQAALLETDANDHGAIVVATETETVAEADRRRRKGGRKNRRRGGKRGSRKNRKHRKHHRGGRARRVLKHVKPWHRSRKNQPVMRTHKPIECLDGDCVRANKVRKAKIGDHPNGKTKKPSKLSIALGAVKEEIMVRAKELHKEKDWSKKVSNLIDEYQRKLSKVTGNIIHLRAQTKALLRKKKQIQNVQIQQKLRYKLQLAQEDLNRLQKQMEYIGGKENEFSDTEKQLKGTMNALKNSLLKLRGQETQQLAQEGI